MASSSGSGFTASIVNGIANYVSSDLSKLGMANGVTGAIQYVKMVWGASGEANLISDDPVDSSALPVSLNNIENKFLTDALINGMTNANGVTAFSVRILDASGISLGAVSINLGAGMTIVGFAAGATNANLGVTFGAVSMSGGYLPVTNRIIGGVTQSIQVTGGMYILGGTVAVSGLELGSLNLDLSGGITINGMTGTNKLGVTFGDVRIANIINTNISSMSAGVTFAAILASPDGTYLGLGTGGSLYISGITGAVPVGVTIVGTAGVTFGGITGSVSILGTAGVTFGGITGSVSISGTASVTGGVHLLGSPNIGINSSNNTVKIEPKTTGATFGVVFTNKTGTPLGQSGSEVVGLPVFGISGATAINVTIVGGLSGMTITGLAFPTSFGVSGGTLAVSGGTLDYIERIGSISGGTLNIGNTVSVTGSISVNNLPSTQNVSVVNTGAIKVGLDTFSNTSSVSLKSHLEGLTVSLLGGGAGGGGLGDVTSISGASMGFAVGSGMTGITGIGVTFAPIAIASMPQVVISNTQAVNVQGGSLSLTTNPVGITLPGNLVGLRGFGVSGEYLGVTLVGVGMSGNALNVSIVGGLSGITITGFAFPSFFGVSGGTLAVSGGTLDYIGTINSIKGGTLNIGNTVGITGSVRISEVSQGITFKTVLVDQNGNILTNEKGIPVFGVSGATAVGITWSGTPTFGISGPVSVQQVKGSTFGVVFTNNFGVPLGLSGSTVVGMPVFGISGATVIGVTFAGISIVGIVATTASLSFPTSGVTMIFENTGTSGIPVFGVSGATAIGVVFTNNFGVPLGMSGATVVGMPVFGVSGATALRVTFTNNFGVPLGLSGATVVGMPVFGVSGATALGVVFTNNFGAPLGLSGATVVGMPVFGVSGATAIGVTGSVYLIGASYNTDNKLTIGIWHGVTVTGTSSTQIGVTFGSVTIDTVAELQVKTKSGTTLAVGGLIGIEPKTTGTTFGVVFTNNFGAPLGISGSTVVGMPVFGVSGATAIGITFGAITFGAGGMGVTFGGITFNTTRTIITGASFGAGLGVPVYGIVGTTAVQVTIIGGTVSGIFTTEAQGITITGVTTGIPVFGVAGGTAIGVTFSGGSIGVTIAGGITGGVYLLGSPAVTGSVHLLGTPSVVISSGTITSITNDVNVAPASQYRNTEASNTVLAARTAAGFVVTQKAGSNFARGLTLDATFIGQAFVSDSLVFGSGSTAYYLKSDPVCVTKDYTGPGRIIGASVEGNPSVPLKVGLYIQLTKWDLISHVLVGYTAGTTQEFARNAQTLTREYQVAPIWGNAMEQFRKYAGASGNSSTFTDTDITVFPETTPLGNTYQEREMVQKQFVGVIEKPTRLFIPCKDAGEVYVQVVGDYTNHAIGSGFWSHEGASAQWSAHTLYERGYYTSDFSGMAGNADGYTDLDVNGNPAGIPESGLYVFTGNPYIAIQKIIDSYANNPFIRIWGH